MTSKKDLLRKLPPVDEILLAPEIDKLLKEYPRSVVVDSIREKIDHTRRDISRDVKGTEAELKVSKDRIIADVTEHVKEQSKPSLKHIVNATGVVLHTNLGRSILPEAAVTAISDISKCYSNLEFDYKKNTRGSRHVHVESLLCKLTGAEAAMIVNNNAAAVLLALSALARDRDVIVSRGQLVEIGGAFRIPDVMRQSGAHLKEVGTTNKTHLADFRNAISQETALLMRVHPSNYRVVGFSAEVSLEELVTLGKEFELPVLDDLGSGVILDLKEFGIPGEPTVSECVATKADVVTCSGDKLLGGPQAGIIVGRTSSIQRMKKHPLARAMRVDKMTVAALEATLRLYLDTDVALKDIPTVRMLTMSEKELSKKAKKLKEEIEKKTSDKVKITTKKDVSKAGGGSLPLLDLPTTVVSIHSPTITVNDLESKLRQAEPPVIARIQDDRLLLDVRTVQEGEEKIIADALGSIVKKK